MTYNVIIKAEAHADALHAYLYYEEQQQGLGEKFLDTLIKRYEDLTLHPVHYGFINKDPLKVLRDVRLKSFPYVIVFEIINYDVIVYAVHHHKSHPKRKLRKR